MLDFTQNGVVQGAVEGANVNPVEEMTKLIDADAHFRRRRQRGDADREPRCTDAIKTLGVVGMTASRRARRRPSGASDPATPRAMERGSPGPPRIAARPRQRRRHRDRDVALPRRRPVALRAARRMRAASTSAIAMQIGEVVRIEDRRDHAEAVRRALRRRHRRARLSRRKPVAVARHESWKGRVIDALGRPIDERRRARHRRSADAARRRAAARAAGARALRSRSGPASASSTCSRRCARASASACSPAPASANRRCWPCSPARPISTPWSSRWSASAAAKCANSSTTRSATIAQRRSPSSRPATKAR